MAQLENTPTGADASTSDDEAIARALMRIEKAVERTPGFGCSQDRSTTVLVDRLRCHSEDGGHRIETDLPNALGGDGSGPSPSALLRAALGSCLAMGYRLRAARHGVPITSLQVVVEADSAIAGLVDPDSSTPPGPTGIRCLVNIESPAPIAEIDRIVQQADELSPLLDAMTRPVPVQRTLTLNGVDR